MTMLKSAYIIDAEELQKKILSEIDSVKHCYCKWKEPGSEDADFYYMLFKEHYGVLRMLLAIQGNSDSEVATILNYMKDLAYRESIRDQINYLDDEIEDLGTKMYEIIRNFKVEDDGESEKPRYYAVKAQRDELINRRNVLIHKIAK
ncbi:hypothetical protein ACG98G_04915 [Megasphaera hexanoica]|uniref:Transposase n=1 Tax=Megasphaera hexanoica TaxID=1675036 RepID=A0ABW7DQ16_9FIRM|nr:hypothetical protein [Megasphaera hexanoica]AXB82619.1 hypothetical protein ACT01_10455 [Megasphaera hexanoica]